MVVLALAQFQLKNKQIYIIDFIVKRHKILTATPASQLDCCSVGLSIYSPMKKVANTPPIINNKNSPQQPNFFNVAKSNEFSMRNMRETRPATVPNIVPIHQIPWKELY